MEPKDNQSLTKHLETVIEQNKEMIRQARELLERSRVPLETLEAMTKDVAMNSPRRNLSPEGERILKEEIRGFAEGANNTPGPAQSLPQTNKSRRLSKIVNSKRTI